MSASYGPTWRLVPMKNVYLAAAGFPPYEAVRTASDSRRALPAFRASAYDAASIPAGFEPTTTHRQGIRQYFLDGLNVTDQFALADIWKRHRGRGAA